jgi:hypothetical protein
VGARVAARRRLRRVLQQVQEEEQVSLTALLAATRPVLDASDARTARGSEGAQVTPPVYIEYLDDMRRGMDAFRSRGGGPTDDRCVKARDIYRRTRDDYAVRWQEFSRDPDLGHLHDRPDAGSVVNAACHDLAQIVGILGRPMRPPRRRIAPGELRSQAEDLWEKLHVM